MRAKIRYFIKWIMGKRNSIQIGDREIQVKPIKAKATLQVLLLIVPYFRDIIPELLATKDLMEPKIFKETMRRIMISMIDSFPEDMLKTMAIFLDVDKEWLELNCGAEEAFEAFGVIMRVNRLDDLMRLGLSVGMISFGDLAWLRNVAE